MQLREIRNIFREELGSLYSPEEADTLFYRVLEHHLGLPRFVLGLEPEKIVSREEEQPLFEALSALKEATPIQYVTGIVHFCGRELKVRPGVLIPRPETEDLVRWILERHGEEYASGRLLDIGTGSGCIAISLAAGMPGAEIHALDISADALRVAEENAMASGVSVRLHKSDIREPGKGWPDFDLIASNPPYVPRSGASLMHPNVRDHEPEQALFAPDDNPLEYYHAILDFACSYLKPGGWLYLEIHEQFGPEVESLLAQHGFGSIQLKKDIFGKDRYVCGQKPIPTP